MFYIILGWFGFSVASFFIAVEWWRREGMDFETDDLAFFLGTSILGGPLSFIATSFLLIGHFVSSFVSKNVPNKTIWKAK